MSRSTKDAWLSGAGDLKEEEVEDVPVPGQSVLVRALAARYSAEVQGQLKLTTEGIEQVQVAKIDVAAMERLQFRYGVVDPRFSLEEVTQIQEKWGPAFRRVVAKIDELSGINKEAIIDAEQRFPVGGASEAGTNVGNGVADGSAGPDLSARAGA